MWHTQAVKSATDAVGMFMSVSTTVSYSGCECFVSGWMRFMIIGLVSAVKTGWEVLNLMKNKLNSVAIVLAAPLTGMLISSPFFPRPVSLSQLLYSAVGFNFSFSCLHLSSLLCGHKGPVFLLTIILISWGISGLLLRKDLTFFVFEIVCRLAHNW